MSGISPNGGVSASSTTNTAVSPLVKAGCNLLYYKLSCNPKFDPAAANAVISEFLNFMKAMGHEWDCESLTNLADAMSKFACSLPVVVAPDLTDSVVGCFNGVQGRVTIDELKAIIDPGSVTFDACSIPDIASPDLDDTLVGCFDGVTGRATIQSILNVASSDITIVKTKGAAIAGAPVSFGETLTMSDTTTGLWAFLHVDNGVVSGTWMRINGVDMAVVTSGTYVWKMLIRIKSGRVYASFIETTGALGVSVITAGPTVWTDCGVYNGTTVTVTTQNGSAYDFYDYIPA